MTTALDGTHVTRWGDAGPVALLIHGGPQGGPAGGADQWAAQRPLAERGRRLVLPDRPGHGRSPSRGPEDMELDAEWAGELLTGLAGDGPVHVVGHSYGGCIALIVAAQRAGQVASLTLIEAPVFAAARHDPEARELRDDLAGLLAAELEPIPRLVEFSRAVRIPADRGGPVASPAQLTAMGAALVAMRSPTDWDGRIAVETVARARVPVLALTGAGHPGFDAIGAGLATATGGEHRVIACGHHFPHLLADEANDILNAFWSRAEALAVLDRQFDLRPVLDRPFAPRAAVDRRFEPGRQYGWCQARVSVLRRFFVLLTLMRDHQVGWSRKSKRLRALSLAVNGWCASP